MIVQFGQPSPWHVGQSSRRLYSARSVGIGTRPRRWAIISSNRGPTLSYSLPSSARIGPRWNSTSSIAIFGTSETRTRTWIESIPFSFAASATRSAAFIAAYGDASSFAALTTIPPVAFVIVSEPVMSVSVMMMLLYDAKMWATPQRGIVQAPFGAPLGVGAPGPPGSSGPSSSSPPSAADGAGGCPVCRTGCKSLEIAERSSYVMTFSSVRLTRTPGIVTRRPPTDTWPWTMNCRAWRGVKARPLRNVSVWRRRERIASTSRARTSSRVVPSSGRSPRRPSRRRSCSRSFSACLSFCRTRACSSRARWRNRRRTYWERQSSFLFFSPYFFRSSFSALMRSASHGWEGRSNFARENFGSPNDSHLGRFLLLFFLLFLLRGSFLRLLRLGGGEGGLLRHPDGQPGPAVGPRALPADLLSGLVADALVRTNHLHAVDVVPPADLDIGAGPMEGDSRLPVLRAIHHPMREGLSEVRERRLDLVRLLLRQVAESLGPRDAREIGDRLGDPDADARDRGERIGDRPRAIEVRVRHSDDVAEIFLHAL